MLDIFLKFANLIILLITIMALWKWFLFFWSVVGLLLVVARFLWDSSWVCLTNDSTVMWFMKASVGDFVKKWCYSAFSFGINSNVFDLGPYMKPKPFPNKFDYWISLIFRSFFLQIWFFGLMWFTKIFLVLILMIHNIFIKYYIYSLLFYLWHTIIFVH